MPNHQMPSHQMPTPKPSDGMRSPRKLVEILVCVTLQYLGMYIGILRNYDVGAKQLFIRRGGEDLGFTPRARTAPCTTSSQDGQEGVEGDHSER